MINDQDVVRLLISYSGSRVSLRSAREDVHYPEHRVGLGDRNLRVYYIFDEPEISPELLQRICERQLTSSDGWATIYPESIHEQVVQAVADAFREDDQEIDIEGGRSDEENRFWTELLDKNLPGLTGRTDLSLNYTLWSITPAQPDGTLEEETVAIEQFVNKFWNRDPALKSILLHAYLLEQQPEPRKIPMFSQLKRRVAAKPSQLEAHIATLEHAEILELGGSCFLRSDNGASQAVEQLVMREYEIDQDLDGMKGAEFLRISFDGRRAPAKRFAETIKGTLLKNLPYLRCIDLSSKPYTFELFLPGKWFAVFLCKTSSGSLGEQFVALAQAQKDKLNSWLVMRSAFAVACGPAFSAGATSLAQTINVDLIEAVSFLKLSKYLSSLENETRAAVHDYFPLIFSLSSGLVPMGRAITTVQEAMEGK